jgi:hypothetical protein
MLKSSRLETIIYWGKKWKNILEGENNSYINELTELMLWKWLYYQKKSTDLVSVKILMSFLTEVEKIKTKIHIKI